MRSRSAAAAVAVVCLALGTGCARTTDGEPVSTRSPGAAATSVPATSTPPSRSKTPSTSRPPASTEAMTMTCEEFGALDTARQKAVVRELIADGQTPFTEQDVDVATTLADSVCAFLPDNLVVDVLLGGG